MNNRHPNEQAWTERRLVFSQLCGGGRPLRLDKVIEGRDPSFCWASSALAFCHRLLLGPRYDVPIPVSREDGQRGKGPVFLLWRLHLFWNAFLVHH